MENKNKFLTKYAKYASLNDISIKHLNEFVSLAKKETGFEIKNSQDKEAILNDLTLMDEGGIYNAALILFGEEPQKFCPQAVIKCSHFYGQEPSKPIPSHRIFGGTLFEQIELAVDFVLSKLDRRVGHRIEQPRAEIDLEMPSDAISEIIINAIVHRDYDSKGSVQIAIFADRIEIMNPGRLPESLVINDLYKKHISIPVNPFLARPFFLAGYIEQIGTGTLNVINSIREINLPLPEFQQLNNQFIVTLFRDQYSQDILQKIGANERQLKGINYLKEEGAIDNSTYRELTGVTRKTASRDLGELVEKGVLIRKGQKRGTYYILGKMKNH